MEAEKCNVAGAFHPKWFGLALQALTILAKENISTCPSGALAAYLQSEPTVLRRMLAVLAKEGIVETREGRDGGYRLVRAPETITLAEVYRVLKVSSPANYAIMETTGTHSFGKGMRTFFTELTEEMDRAILVKLGTYTIADCVSRVEGCGDDGQRHGNCHGEDGGLAQADGGHECGQADNRAEKSCAEGSKCD